MKFKRNLNSKCDRVFQTPKRKFNVNSHIWYNKPMGLNTLGNVMSRTSKKVG